MDAMTALALGAGLQSFGQGWQGLRDQDAVLRERAADRGAAQKARQGVADQQAAADRERRRLARMNALQAYYQAQDVFLTPSQLEAMVDAEMGDGVGKTPVPPVLDDGVDPLALRDRSTLPGGVDRFAAPSGPASAPATPSVMEMIAQAQARAAESGQRVEIPGGRGFVRPSERRPRRTQYDPDRGGIVDLDTGAFTPSPNLPARTPRPTTPDPVSTYEERAERGGVAIYENGRFKAWKVRPADEPTGADGAPLPGTALPTAERNKVAAQQRALRDVASSLTDFEATIANGIDLMPGPGRANMQTSYGLLQMQLKELMELGVLNGPDLMLIQRMVNEPTGVWLQSQRALGAKPEDVLRGQIAALRRFLANKERNLLPPTPGTPSDTVQTSTGRTFTRVTPE